MKRRKIIIKKNKIIPSLVSILLIIFVFAVFLWTHSNYSNFKKVFNRNLYDPSVKKDRYLQLANELSSGGIPIAYLSYLDSETIEASLSSGTKVIFSLEKDTVEQVSSLQLILSRFRIEGRKANLIDLRFKNVVVD